jgi:hypothetical protein
MSAKIQIRTLYLLVSCQRNPKKHIFYRLGNDKNIYPFSANYLKIYME